MANPPIVIPPFDNVPAPGSPIRSNWPQEITNYVVTNLTPGVVYRAFDGAVVTSAGGDFAVGVGGVPSAAVCVSSLADYPFVFTVRDAFGGGQVVFRAYRLDGSIAANLNLEVSVIIIGPPAGV